MLPNHVNLYGLATCMAPNSINSEGFDGRLFRRHRYCVRVKLMSVLGGRPEPPRGSWAAAVPSRDCGREPSRRRRGGLGVGKTMNGTSGFLGRFIKRRFCHRFAFVWPPGWLCHVFPTFLQRFAFPEKFRQRFQRFCNVLYFDQRSHVVPCHGTS